MRRRLLHLSVTLLTFAAGLCCAAALADYEPPGLKRLGFFVPGAVTLAASALCFRQALWGERGLRRSVCYNMLMLTASALLFIFGLILSLAAFEVLFQ